MEGTARAAARSYREVLLAGEQTLLLVGAGNGVLEAGGVGRVTRDRYVDILLPHDGYALAHVIGAVAAYLRTQTVRVGDGIYDLHLTGVVVELRLYICEAVDTRDDLGGVLAQTVEDHAQGVLAHAVCHLGDLDGALGCGERLVACEECEALGLLAQKTCGQITVTQTYLAVIGYRSGDAEGLKTLADSLGGVGGVGAALRDGDGGAHDVSPLGVLEADGLRLLTHLVRIDALGVADGLGLLDAVDSVLGEHLVDVVDSALVALK